MQPSGQRLPEAALPDLRDGVLRHAHAPYAATIVPRLTLTTIRRPSAGPPHVLRPVACLILQGTKRVRIGEATLDLHAGDYLLTSLDVPAAGSVPVATPRHPYVAAGLAIDRDVLSDLIGSMPAPDLACPGVAPPQRGFAVGRASAEQIEAWTALIALLDRPGDIGVLAPSRERELLYRLLQGTLGTHLRQIARENGSLSRVRKAIRTICGHYEEVLPVERLAAEANMSTASFHRHFRAATAMSPLQYQKLVRLQAARRLLAAGMEAGRAAFAVGYASPSQFSREYRRHYGLPPSHDAERLGSDGGTASYQDHGAPSSDG